MSGEITTILPPPSGELSDFVPVHGLEPPTGFSFEQSGSSGFECQIDMIEDAEIGSDCLHISSGALDIPVAKEVSKRFLVLYLKHLNRFTEIEIAIVDDNLVARTITFANHQSAIRLNASEKTCRLPMKLTPSWNYLNIDLQKVLQNAFGVNLSYVQRVKVKAQCRVWRIFFQSRPHAHIELPESLQLPKIE